MTLKLKRFEQKLNAVEKFGCKCKSESFGILFVYCWTLKRELPKALYSGKFKELGLISLYFRK